MTTQAGPARAGSRDLPALVADWPSDAREELEERAAILEHDARMAPDRAERAAEHIVRDRHSRGLL